MTVAEDDGHACVGGAAEVIYDKTVTLAENGDWNRERVRLPKTLAYQAATFCMESSASEIRSRDSVRSGLSVVGAPKVISGYRSKAKDPPHVRDKSTQKAEAELQQWQPRLWATSSSEPASNLGWAPRPMRVVRSDSEQPASDEHALDVGGARVQDATHGVAHGSLDLVLGGVAVASEGADGVEGTRDERLAHKQLCDGGIEGDIVAAVELAGGFVSEQTGRSSFTFMSAMRCETAWCLPMGIPPEVRVRAYLTAFCRRRSITPMWHATRVCAPSS